MILIYMEFPFHFFQYTKKKVVQKGFLEELINVNIECDEGSLIEMNT